MTSTGKFILKLSFLIIPFSILNLILHASGASGGVGGGGYDLSGLVYGSLLYTVIIIWLIWMLISYLLSNTKSDRSSNLQLLLLGLLALVITYLTTPINL
jgi:Kef-type K+ transport system membrane component KefB